MKTPEFKGLTIGIIELIYFFVISTGIKIFVPSLKEIDILSYYWMAMTILTAIWEMSYILNIKSL